MLKLLQKFASNYLITKTILITKTEVLVKETAYKFKCKRKEQKWAQNNVVYSKNKKKVLKLNKRMNVILWLRTFVQKKLQVRSLHWKHLQKRKMSTSKAISKL